MSHHVFGLLHVRLAGLRDPADIRVRLTGAAVAPAQTHLLVSGGMCFGFQLDKLADKT